MTIHDCYTGNLIAYVPYDSETMISGGQIEFELDHPPFCLDCKGLGHFPTERQCRDCSGTGKVEKRVLVFKRRATCRACQGLGVEWQKCNACDGEGFANSDTTIHIEVPAGLYPHMALELKNLGERRGPNEDLGALLLNFSYIHSRFTLFDSDIVEDVFINDTQAKDGLQTKYRSVVAGPIDLNIPAGTGDGALIRIPGAGLPDLSDLEVPLPSAGLASITHCIPLEDLQSADIETLPKRDLIFRIHIYEEPSGCGTCTSLASNQELPVRAVDVCCDDCLDELWRNETDEPVATSEGLDT